MLRLVLEQVLEGHSDRVWHLAWSPQGDTLASCSSDKTVRLWCPGPEGGAAVGGAAPGAGVGAGVGVGARQSSPSSPLSLFACAAKLEDSHTKTVRCAAWSPDGALLLTVSFDARAALWRRTLPPPSPSPSPSPGAPLAAAAAAADAAAPLTAAGRARWRQVWASGACHESEIKGADWSPCGGFAATCGRDRHVWVWELTAGGGENGGAGGESGMDDDGDGDGGDGDGDGDDENGGDGDGAAARPKEGAAALEAVDVKSGHSGDVKAVAWHPRGDGVFATCSYDDSVRVWAADGGLGAAAAGGGGGSGGGEWACEQVLEARAEEGGRAVELEVWGDDDGGAGAAGGEGTAAAAAAAAGGGGEGGGRNGGGNGGGGEGGARQGAAAAAAGRRRHLRPFVDRGGHASTVWDVRFSRHDGGARMATASADGTVRVWSAGFEPGSGGRRPAFAGESVVLAGLRPKAAAAGEDGGGGRDDDGGGDDTGDDDDDDDARPADVLSVDWSARGLLATGDARNALRVFEPVAASGDEAADGGQAAAAAAAAAAAGTAVTAAAAGTAARPPLPPSWRLAAQASHPQDVNCVRWHPTDATLAATACDDGAVRLWRLVSD